MRRAGVGGAVRVLAGRSGAIVAAVGADAVAAVRVALAAYRWRRAYRRAAVRRCGRG